MQSQKEPILDIISNRISDPELIKLLLINSSDDENELRESQYYRFIMNVLYLTFFMIFQHFYNVRNNINKKFDNYTPSMIRIYNIFETCYENKKISFDTIINFFCELELDSLIKYKDDSDEGITFQKFLDIDLLFEFKRNRGEFRQILDKIQTKLKTYRGNSVTYEELVDFLHIFHFLKHINIEKIPVIEGYGIYHLNVKYDSEKDKKKIEVEIDESVLLLGETLYYLQDIEFEDSFEFDNSKNKSQRLIFIYEKFIGEGKRYIEFVNDQDDYSGNSNRILIVADDSHSVENYLNDYNSIFKYRKDIFFKNYLAFNNRYIKNISAVIVDTISTDVIIDYCNSDKILQSFLIKTRNTKEKVYKWDELVSYLLLKTDVNRFFEFILNKSNSPTVTYNRFISTIKRRFGENKVDEILLTTASAKYTFFSNVKSAFKVKEMADSLVAILLKLISNNEVKLVKNFAPAPIDDIIAKIDNIKEKDFYEISGKQKIIYYVDVLINTLIFLNYFYAAFIESAKVKMTNDISSNYPTKIEDIKKIFKTKIKDLKERNNIKTLQYYKDYDLKTARNVLDKSFNSFWKLNKGTIDDPKESKAFEYLTGKDYIFKASILETRIEKIKNLLNKNTDYDGLSLDVYCQVNSILYYFKNGIEEENKDEIYVNNSIYPVIVSCSSIAYQNGFEYATLLVNDANVVRNNENKKSKHIILKALIDESLNFEELYYCLPNTNTIACDLDLNNNVKNYIWLHPTFIPLSCYSEVLDEEYMYVDSLSNISVFETITSRENSEANISRIVELLFSTDEKAYMNLFGNLDNACQIIKELFYSSSDNRRETNIFYNDYFRFIVKNVNNNYEILALATLYTNDDGHSLERTIGMINKIIEQKGLEKSVTFNDGVAEFKKIFSDSFNGVYYVGELAVNKKYFNKGIAKLLLSRIITIAEKENKNVLIALYPNNHSAMHVYETMGFCTYVEGENSTGEQLNKLVRFTK